jgi:hypothetical protein
VLVNLSTSFPIVRSLILIIGMLQALLYSLEHKIPLVAFSQDHCYSMFDDSLVDSLHYVYHEPKV